ncbi:hypothetical protein V6N12_054365 [Hibiscus sabdariffa]|uniref:RNase H type-1 domain-containing protein n=1 Tax=Hibiscus sabdariffa TaxID=183260 RepID=A0ABR2D070_9ROSI
MFCWLIWKQRCNATFGKVISNGTTWVRYGNQLVDGFTTTLNRGNNIELWAMHDVLTHAWSIGVRNVELETDSLDAYKIISRSSSTLANTLLVDDLLELINRSWNVQLRHVSRVQNVVADKLAALSRDKEIDEIVWVNPLGEVLDALHHDMVGIHV